MKNENNVVNVGSDGKLTIKDSKAFISMLHGDSEVNAKNYKILIDFAFKQKNRLAPEIPPYDYQYIINFAIVKAINGHTEEGGAQLQSYFWEKLRGEISAYRSKQISLQKKVIAAMEEGNGDNVEYMYQKGAGANNDENHLEIVDMESIEDKIIKEDKFRRQIKAFKMAFSGIPRELQIILNEVSKGKNIRIISEIMGFGELKVSQKRNYALSLILQRVIRSNHLTDEEKEEVAELHGFNYNPEEFNQINKENIRED